MTPTTLDGTSADAADTLDDAYTNSINSMDTNAYADTVNNNFDDPYANPLCDTPNDIDDTAADNFDGTIPH
ncbi:MAG: hypothetical protein LBT55_03430 [Clostridiaceae bacterium]|nr:hypothetical protein [Clostridiaceae bacterium]